MPDFKVEIRARLAKLKLSPVREAEIVEELSQHLEEEYERALRSGSSEEEARQRVLEQLAASDLLHRELEHVERSRLARTGRARRTIEGPIFLAISPRTSAMRCGCWQKIQRSHSSL